MVSSGPRLWQPPGKRTDLPRAAAAAAAAAGRRASKLVSLVTSSFTGNYVRYWVEHLPGTPLRSTPMFDGRAVCYPSDTVLRDYLAWRQADTHINNLVRASWVATWAPGRGGSGCECGCGAAGAGAGC